MFNKLRLAGASALALATTTGFALAQSAGAVPTLDLSTATAEIATVAGVVVAAVVLSGASYIAVKASIKAVKWVSQFV